MADTTRTGRCLCGAVTYEAEIAHESLSVCHCETCRKLVGGPFMAVDVQSVTFAEGAPVGVYQSSEWATRSFCKECGGQLAWRSVDCKFQLVAAYSLDVPPAGPLAMQVFIDSKPDAYAFAGDSKTMTGAEIMAMAAASGES